MHDLLNCWQILNLARRPRGIVPLHIHLSVIFSSHTHHSNPEWERDFLAGSYARNTAIRPKKSGDDVERPDVDIISHPSFDVHPSGTDIDTMSALVAS